MLRLPDLNLGELEMAALDHLWSVGEGDVKAIYARIGVGRDIALNTVQSALDRLYRKGILARHKVSHAFVYRALIQRSELVSRAVAAVLGMTGGGGGELLTAFVDIVARTDPAALTELETLLAGRIAAARAGA